MQLSGLYKLRRGFTLLELMIVIAIVGILVSALIPWYTNYIQRWRDTTRISDITDLSKAFTLYFTEYDAYPSSDAQWCVDDTKVNKYTEEIPRHDPIPARWGWCSTDGRYGYASSTGILNNPNVFSLLAVMEQPFWGNYGGELAGFTGTLTASAYNTGINVVLKWAWPYYIRIP